MALRRRGSPGAASPSRRTRPSGARRGFVGGSCSLLQRRGSSGRPAPDQQPGARRCGRSPMQGRVAAASSAGVPRAATYAANSGSTSPCRAQSSSVADSSVVRSRQCRGRRPSTVVGVEPVGRGEHGQPAAQHVVAERRQPVAVADQAVRASRIDAWPRRYAERRRARCGRSGGPRHRIRRARRPKDSAESDPGHANVHESSDEEGVAGQIQGPALNIGAGGAGGEDCLGRHARELRDRRSAQGTWAARERRRRRSGRRPRRTARRGRWCSTGTGPSGARAQVRGDAWRGACATAHARDHGSRRYRPRLRFDRCEVVPTIADEEPQVLTARSRA